MELLVIAVLAVVALLSARFFQKRPTPDPTKPQAVPEPTPEPIGPPEAPEWTRTALIRLIIDISEEESFQFPEIAVAVAKVESNLNPLAKNPTDPSFGLMQLMFGTAKFYVPWLSTPEQLFDPPTNVRAGVRFLKDLHVKHGPDHGLAGIIQMYNLGETKFLKGIRVFGYLAKVEAHLPPGFLP